jgi:hypothetical protein
MTQHTAILLLGIACCLRAPEQNSQNGIKDKGQQM